jgi:hypothetical protein
MSNMPIRWKVRPILEGAQATPYRFWKETGLSRDVAYGIANGDHQALDLGVIEKALPYLRDLSGDSDLQIGDIVEYRAITDC